MTTPTSDQQSASCRPGANSCATRSQDFPSGAPPAEREIMGGMGNTRGLEGRRRFLFWYVSCISMQSISVGPMKHNCRKRICICPEIISARQGDAGRFGIFRVYPCNLQYIEPMDHDGVKNVLYHTC